MNSALGYVSLFHKYEGFTNGVVLHLDKLFKDIFSENENIVTFTKEEFGIHNIKNYWWLTPKLKRINWIVNSVKHYNGYPRPKGSKDYPRFRIGEKIKLEKSDFKSDAQHVEVLTDEFLKIIMAIYDFKSSHLTMSEVYEKNGISSPTLDELKRVEEKRLSAKKMKVKLMLRQLNFKYFDMAGDLYVKP